MHDLITGSELRQQRCVISLPHVAQHAFLPAFYVVRDLRAADIVLGLPWLDDEQATLEFGAEGHFTMIDGTMIKKHMIERRPAFLSMSSTEVHNLLRKSAIANGQTAKNFTVNFGRC
jgi:hypothetical protein